MVNILSAITSAKGMSLSGSVDRFSRNWVSFISRADRVSTVSAIHKLAKFVNVIIMNV